MVAQPCIPHGIGRHVGPVVVEQVDLNIALLGIGEEPILGFSSENLPIGIQLVSQWFDESTILRLGALLERKGGLGDRRPPVSA